MDSGLAGQRPGIKVALERNLTAQAAAALTYSLQPFSEGTKARRVSQDHKRP